MPLPESDALTLLRSLGAPPRLVHHARVVLSVAEELIAALQPWGVPLDAERVRAGAVLHDVGKVVVREELSGPGHRHEEQGQALLLAHGLPPEVARICVSHAQWAEPGGSLEEWVVALADKLWKGKREDLLERCVVARVAELSGREPWEVFTHLDRCFEAVAADAPRRLDQSRRFHTD